MRTAKIILALLLSAVGAFAATQYGALVTITNTPAGLTSNIVINIGASDTRNWTNNASGAPSTSIQITNSIATSVTNLANQLNAYPVYSAGAGTPQLLAAVTNAAIVTLYAPENTNITVTFGGLWAKVAYFTNTYSDGIPIQNRTNSMSATARTNAENAIVNLLARNLATNVVPINSTFLRNYLDTNTAQTAGNKTLIGPVLSGGRATTLTNLTATNVFLTNVTLRLSTTTGGTFSGAFGSVTNGNQYSQVLLSPTLGSPVVTNLINYGNAIRSEGSGGNSLQLGSNAVAAGGLSVAIGNGALASNANSVAIGYSALATNAYAVAIGNLASAYSTSSIAFGFAASASGQAAHSFGNGALSAGASAVSVISDVTGDYSIGIGRNSSVAATQAVAIGYTATVTHNDAVAIGLNATSTETNQVTLGNSVSLVSVPGSLGVTNVLSAGSITNANLTGTNRIAGRLELVSGSRTSMANGYNSGTILGTNVYLRMSGASAALTNAGFSAEFDGSFHVVQVDNPGLSYTILNESGLEATAANRILTQTGALKNSTNNPVIFKMIYDTSVSRWRVFDWPPN